MKIGNVELRHGIMLAPMAGYTDRAMRLVCREAGAEYTVSEMVSAKAVVYNDKKTFSLNEIIKASSNLFAVNINEIIETLQLFIFVLTSSEINSDMYYH